VHHLIGRRRRIDFKAEEASARLTRDVFDRYHIVNDRRWKENTHKLGRQLGTKDEEKPAVQGLIQ
jgi:hypothetical protein